MTGVRLVSGARTVLLALLVAAGGAVTGGYLYLRGARPALSGEATVGGIGAPVRVELDRFAIPQVFAEDQRDLFFAQGWLHASERLWQMEVLRRTARGRLSGLFGEPAVEADRLLRTLDLWEAARRSVGATADEELELLVAYSAGVNARLSSWEGAWPPEFELLGVEPGAWSPVATAAIAKVMALDLSPYRTELSRFHAWRELPAEKYRLVRARYPAWGPTILGPGGPGAGGAFASGALPAGEAGGEEGRTPAATGRADGAAAGTDALAFLDALGLSPGSSNAWAVAGARSATGAPLLASDMHLSLRAPAIWHVMGLHAPEEGLSVAGVTLPGVPGVVVGYNRHVAWAFTNGMVDDMDFAVETVSPDGSAYRTEAGWTTFSVRPETIRVRGRAEPVVHPVRETVRGPVVTDVLDGLGATLSAAWLAHRPTAPLEGLLAMNRARGAAAFDRAVRAFEEPHQNVIFAARGDTLGYRLSGRVPRRPGFDGRLPVGAEAFGRGWEGVRPPDSMPAGLYPPGSVRGFLASANNLQGPGFFGWVGVDYPTPFRARRITDRLRSSRSWTVEGMADLQRDVRSLLADRLTDEAAEAARRVGADSASRLLAGWDHRASLDSRAAGLFYAWAYRLRALVAADEYGGSRWGRFPLDALTRVVEREAGAAWIDDVRTPVEESLEELEERAIRDALEATRIRRWGELHRERSTHLLGRVDWLDRLFGFHVGPYPAPGAPGTVRAVDVAGWSSLDSAAWRPPYLGDYGPTERFVARMGPGTPMAWILLPTGQSGIPFSGRYRDMADRWTGDGRLIPLPLDSTAIAARTSRTLVLRPGG